MTMTQHFVQLGRSKQHGWLILDNQPKITGRSKGSLFGLNVNSNLYVGGLDFFKDENLAADMDFTDGFSGKSVCVCVCACVCKSYVSVKHIAL